MGRRRRLNLAITFHKADIACMNVASYLIPPLCGRSAEIWKCTNYVITTLRNTFEMLSRLNVGPIQQQGPPLRSREETFRSHPVLVRKTFRPIQATFGKQEGNLEQVGADSGFERPLRQNMHTPSGRL